jgi:hypothetical protein
MEVCDMANVAGISILKSDMMPNPTIPSTLIQRRHLNQHNIDKIEPWLFSYFLAQKKKEVKYRKRPIYIW